jgi:hypothetical protein
MVNCDVDAKFSEEEFLVLMQGILGYNSEKDKASNMKSMKNRSSHLESPFLKIGNKENNDFDVDSVKDSFIKFIFQKICSMKDISVNNNTFNEYFSLYERLSRDNNCLLGLESGLVNRFKSFLLGITISNKKAYLVKFDVLDG